jgi:hypothetical protein
MTERLIIKRQPLVTVDPVLVERARRAIRQRRDYETEVRLAA